MATNFPNSLQDMDSTRGTNNQPLAQPSHVTHHKLEDDTIEALQAKVGVDNSAVTSSLDYKLTNASSVSPGHKHVAADISDLLPISSSTGVADGGKLVKTNFVGKLDTSFIYPSVVRTYAYADSPVTWTKPTGLVAVLVRLWGAGGAGGLGQDTSGSGGGGGGGEYIERILYASALGATETITIGAGGAGTGGDTTFGSLLTADGGNSGGVNNGTDAGGGSGGNKITLPYIYGTAGVSGVSATDGGNGLYSGGGGATGSVLAKNGGSSVYGGAGGGAGLNAGSALAGTGGTSTFGGAGGAGSASGTATAGSVPGGGGGGSGSSSGSAGAGANGQAQIIEIF